MADLPEDVLLAVERSVGAPVVSVVPVGGGCIANASRVTTARGSVFLKWATGPAGETFAAEGEGLSALAAVSSTLDVPRPLAVRDAEAGLVGFLLMEWIEEGHKSTRFWENLGTGLASLHAADVGSDYGFESPNFIGRLPQSNTPHEDWVDFFAEQRILPQVEMARRGGRWMTAWNDGLSGLLRVLPTLLPSKPHVSLVHGDLWGGNVLAGANGGAAVIDPAVYRGDREVDLAMTELFGGFSSVFYSAYAACWKLDAGYERRRDVYNLYHLINHLNHFGSSYAGQVAAILRRFE